MYGRVSNSSDSEARRRLSFPCCPGDIICAPIAVCKADSEGQNSQCGTSNPCQGSFQLGFFQLCVEQLEDTEVSQ